MAGKAAPRQVRVTVMLGNSLADRETLAVLDLLQAGVPAEVQGLYIEDSGLLSLADIPVVREFCRLTLSERRLETAELERRFRVQARIAERALAEMAIPRGYPWSFRSLRGDPVTLLRQALVEVDLLLLGATAGMLPSTTPRGPDLAKRPVMVVIDQGEAAARAVTVAKRIADTGGTGLVMVLAAQRPEELSALRQRAVELAGDRPVEYLQVACRNTVELLNRLRRQPAGQLVIGIPAGGPDDETIAMLQGRSACPVLLVR